MKVLLGVGTPLVAAVLWGVFAAPQAPVRSAVLALLVKVLVFGAAVLALVVTGHPVLAGALGAGGAAQLPAVDAAGLTCCSRPQTKDARTPPGRWTSQRVTTPGSTLRAPGRTTTSSSTCCQTRRSPAVAGGTGDPGARTRCSFRTEPPGPLTHLPAQVRPQRQRPAADLDVEVAEPAVLHGGRAGRGPPCAAPARAGPRGECCSACHRRVRGVRLGRGRRPAGAAPRRPGPAAGRPSGAAARGRTRAAPALARRDPATMRRDAADQRRPAGRYGPGMPDPFCRPPPAPCSPAPRARSARAGRRAWSPASSATADWPGRPAAATCRSRTPTSSTGSARSARRSPPSWSCGCATRAGCTSTTRWTGTCPARRSATAPSASCSPTSPAPRPRARAAGGSARPGGSLADLALGRGRRRPRRGPPLPLLQPRLRPARRARRPAARDVVGGRRRRRGARAARHDADDAAPGRARGRRAARCTRGPTSSCPSRSTTRA